MRNKIVSDYWSIVDCSASEKNFYCFPPIRCRSSKLIFDEADATRMDWCEYWTVEKYLKDRIPFDKALSICCGFGHVERYLSKLNVARTIVGIDIAEGAITEARKRAAHENLTNISYEVSDVNALELPKEEYGLVWANGALHHIENLEHVIPTLYKSLKSGGMLVSNEYVGPKYQQLGKRQCEVVLAVKHLLPHELRGGTKQSALTGSSLRGKIEYVARRTVERLYKRFMQHEESRIYGKIWVKTPIQFFKITDPSESVRGCDIVPILKRTFDKVEVRSFYGSILLYALDSKFYDNFDSNSPKHRRILEMLFDIEDTLIETGEIDNDNAHIICWKN